MTLRGVKMKYPVVLLILLPVMQAQAYCFEQAGRAFHLSPSLLKSIAIQESGLNASAINRANRNKTEDVCMMQINSVHYARLQQLGITRQRLLKEPCLCVYTGAWVLSGLFQRYGKSWDTVGMYNTGPSPARKQRRLQYAGKVKQILADLQSQPQPDTDKLAKR
jgi:soluble lytic murein transglycosylase-like protein